MTKNQEKKDLFRIPVPALWDAEFSWGKRERLHAAVPEQQGVVAPQGKSSALLSNSIRGKHSAMHYGRANRDERQEANQQIEQAIEGT